MADLEIPIREGSPESFGWTLTHRDENGCTVYEQPDGMLTVFPADQPRIVRRIDYLPRIVNG